MHHLAAIDIFLVGLLPRKYQVVISDEGNVIKTQQLGNAVNQRAMGSAPTLVLIAMNNRVRIADFGPGAGGIATIEKVDESFIP